MPAPSVVVPQEVAALGYQQLEMRKRIAMQMMMQKQRAYPKTVGEGLSAVGGSIGDASAMQALQQQQAQYEAQRQKQMEDALEQAQALKTAGV